MKSLSLKQPYPELILKGDKIIELRNWYTSFRGDFLIHSSKHPDKKAMEKFGFMNLPCGYILGKATLKDVKKYNSQEEFLRDSNKHLGEGFYENYPKYGFILENTQRIDPFPAKGKLNFWNFDLNKIK